MLRSVLLMITLGVCVFSSVATAEQIDERWITFRLATVGNKITEDETRKAIARQIFNDCTEITSLIPELSPREQEWLDRELSARRWSVIESTEYFQSHVKKRLSSCRVHTTFLMEQIEKADRQAAEFQVWMRLGRVLSEINEQYTRKRLESIRVTIPDHHLVYLESGNSIAVSILNYVLLPLHLEREDFR